VCVKYIVITTCYQNLKYVASDGKYKNEEWCIWSNWQHLFSHILHNIWYATLSTTIWVWQMGQCGMSKCSAPQSWSV
jgi:hypothetical protein